MNRRTRKTRAGFCAYAAQKGGPDLSPGSPTLRNGSRRIFTDIEDVLG